MYYLFRAESRLANYLESKSNDSDLLTPSPKSPRSPRAQSNRHLLVWSSLDKTKFNIKIKALELEKKQGQEQIQQLLMEKDALINEVTKLKQEKMALKVQYESLKESFGTFKESVSNREDPFVLKLALDQSRKDFSRLIDKVI